MSLLDKSDEKKLSGEEKSVDHQKDQQARSTPGRVPLWPAVIAFLVIGVLFSLLSEQLTIGPSWLLLLLLAAIMIPFVLGWLREHHHLSRFLGRVSMMLITLAVAVGVLLLVLSLPKHTIAGSFLLRDAAILWATNIITFGLWYWELDGGGPAVRHHFGYKATDFLFPQLLAGEPYSTKWSPGFIDYIYLAFNTSTAFSPTDTSVLSQRAKLLMMVQSVLSLVVVAVLAARAINILPTGS